MNIKNEIYEIKVESNFSSAHFLREYEGDCARLHGHSWKIQALYECGSLDSIGIGIDFRIVKKQLKELINQWDHFCLNEIPPFDKINPTAENIARIAYLYLIEKISQKNIKLKSVTIFESESACVTYSV